MSARSSCPARRIQMKPNSQVEDYSDVVLGRLIALVVIAFLLTLL
jgi:hypothetical protein